jgi:hypothetical protein
LAGIKEGAPEALVPILGIAHRVLGPSRFPDYAATVTERSCVVDSYPDKESPFQPSILPFNRLLLIFGLVLFSIPNGWVLTG